MKKPAPQHAFALNPELFGKPVRVRVPTGQPGGTEVIGSFQGFWYKPATDPHNEGITKPRVVCLMDNGQLEFALYAHVTFIDPDKLVLS